MKSLCDPVPAWQRIQNKMRVSFGWLATRATDCIATLLLFALPSISTLHAQGLIYDEREALLSFGSVTCETTRISPR